MNQHNLELDLWLTKKKVRDLRLLIGNGQNNRWQKGKGILPEGNLDSTTGHFSAALYSIGPSIRGPGNVFNSIPLADPTIVSHLSSEPRVGPVVPKNKPFNIPQSKVGAVKGPRNVDQVKKAITELGLILTIELGLNSVRVFQGQIMKVVGKTLSSSKTFVNQGWTEEGFFLGCLRMALHCMMIDKIISTPQLKPLSQEPMDVTTSKSGMGDAEAISRKGKTKTVDKGSGERLTGSQFFKNINKVVQGKGNKFKAAGNSRILLRESMTELVETISSQANGVLGLSDPIQREENHDNRDPSKQ
ncbi:hypothetical protein GOBAR_DD26899 [Gossypium barbadense]|nr:hypothetical protein GOBAR_DD26899 [Gossypium barbadense]